MDDEKKCDMDPESHAHGDSNNELNEKKQESSPFDEIPKKNELSVSNETDTAFFLKKDPQALDSVHKYASRIKSFLGWDSDNEESKIVKDLDDIINSINDTNTNPELDQGIGDNSNLEEMDENYPGLNRLEQDKINTEQNDEEHKRDIDNPYERRDVEELRENDKKEQYGAAKENSISESLLPGTSENVDQMDRFAPEENMQSQNADGISITESLSPDVNKNGDLEDTFIGGESSTIENIQDTQFSPEEELPNEIKYDNLSKNNLNENTSEHYVQSNNAETEVLSDDQHTFEKEVDEISSKNSTADDLIKPTNESKDESSSITSQENSVNADSNDKDAKVSESESSDKECEDENISFNKNITKPHLQEIRRLSMDIVKDVIDSARSSIHEIFLNKIELDKNLQGNFNEETKSDLVKCKIEFLQEKDIDEADPHRNGSENSGDDTKILESNDLTKKSLDSMYYEKETNGIDSSEYKEVIPEQKESLKDIESLIDPDTICGFGCFKPKCIQKWATPRSYLVLFSLLGVIHGIYYSYFVGMISTLEKRYAFKTKVSGTLLLADEISPLLFGILVGYIGGKTHRPRMTALGMLMAVACCFITAFPYFIYGSTPHLKLQNLKNHTDVQYCDIETEKSLCNEDDQPPTVSVVVLFIVASFLKGFATISYYVLGISYMDDNTSKKSTPLYLAIALALRLLGPLLGYLMSFVFLKMYENPFEDPGFGPDDPRWIGAWWLGFCVQGVLLLIFTIPIALFPRRMPGQRRPDQAKEETLREMFSGLYAATKRLAKNPVFIFLTLNTILVIFGHFGHLIMLPKYMENQFRLSASDASLFSGVTSVSCVMVSTVLGGFIIWKFKPTAKMLLGGMVASEIILVLGFVVLTIPRCQEIEMSHYGRNNDGLILDSMCNEMCNCPTTSFTPFCGPNGKTIYFSPCHAGCTEQLNTSMLPEKHKKFGNCSCVTDALGNAGGQIVEGFCSDDTCWNQAIAYIIILLIMLTICNTLAVAHTIILLRSVHPNDKSFALGTFETFICLCGFIPGPVTYGALVDSSCLVWEKSCDQTGNCWFYDMNRYNYSLHVTSSIFCGLSTLCLITLYFLNSRIRNLYVDGEDEQNYVNVKLDTVSGSVTKL